MTESITTLDASKIVRTIDLLLNRIEERFPKSGLLAISNELKLLGEKATAEAELFGKPILWIRGCVGFLLVLIFLVLASVVVTAFDKVTALSNASLMDWMFALEAGTNELVFIGFMVIFLIGLERRVKRNRALKAIHKLRSIAHVIDMHQLTKDPSRYSSGAISTASSPKRELTLAQLMRYLNYCSELLSLNGKIAALYIQRFDDAVALASASELETLLTGLCQKIWQKIVIAEDLTEKLGQDRAALTDISAIPESDLV